MDRRVLPVSVFCSLIKIALIVNIGFVIIKVGVDIGSGLSSRYAQALGIKSEIPLFAVAR
jgi:hypothetical protein